jgi:hypothetical protein
MTCLHLSFAQGGFGSRCPNPQHPTTQPGCIRDVCFPTAFPQGISFGGKTWNSAAAVDSFLPARGSEVIIGQTLTLQLSIGFDAPTVSTLCQKLLIGTSSNQGKLKNVVFHGSGPLNGRTYNEILTAAIAMLNSNSWNWFIGGRLVTQSEFNSALDDINNGRPRNNRFHECNGRYHTRTARHSVYGAHTYPLSCVWLVACCQVTMTTVRRRRHPTRSRL